MWRYILVWYVIRAIEAYTAHARSFFGTWSWMRTLTELMNMAVACNTLMLPVSNKSTPRTWKQLSPQCFLISGTVHPIWRYLRGTTSHLVRDFFGGVVEGSMIFAIIKTKFANSWVWFATFNKFPTCNVHVPKTSPTLELSADGMTAVDARVLDPFGLTVVHLFWPGPLSLPLIDFVCMLQALCSRNHYADCAVEWGKASKKKKRKK